MRRVVADGVLRFGLLLLAGIAQAPVRWLLWLAWPLTWLAWPFTRRRRAVIARNLELAFPGLSEAARRQLLRRNLHASVRGLLEALIALGRRRPLPTSEVRVEGLDALRAARAAGRGVILVGCHVTSLTPGLRALAEALGEPITQVVRRHRNPAFEDFVDAGRRRVGPTLAKKDLGGMLASLRAGRVLAIAPDQDHRRPSAFVPFFGVPASTIDIVPRLAGKCGAAVVAAIAFRVGGPGGGHWQVTLAAMPTADARASVTAWLRWCEEAIRSHPEQYLWAHRRYKTAPPGEAPRYRRG